MASVESFDFYNQVTDFETPFMGLYTDLELINGEEFDGDETIDRAKRIKIAISHIKMAMQTSDLVPESLLTSYLEQELRLGSKKNEASLTVLPIAIKEPEADVAVKLPTSGRVTKYKAGTFGDIPESKFAVDKLPTADQDLLGIFNYVLHGAELPLNLNNRDVRKTLQMIAGTKELKDKDVGQRFNILNGFLMGEIDPYTEVPKPIKLGEGYIILSKLGGFNDQRAACLGADPSKFFTLRGESTKDAKKVCNSCLAQKACLEYALANNEKHGIWGGKSERERRKIRRQRSLELAHQKKLEAEQAQQAT
jgi:WhiB family redox-sensing transcriptional regulator